MRRARFAISAAFLAWGGSRSTFVARIIFAELVGAAAVALNVFRVWVYSGFDLECLRRNNTGSTENDCVVKFS